MAQINNSLMCRGCRAFHFDAERILYDLSPGRTARYRTVTIWPDNRRQTIKMPVNGRCSGHRIVRYIYFRHMGDGS